ncbi:CAP domain-containing protein [Pseudomonas sp. SA3-5]|uniref:CAP domain-containing protein n=1 Tax=Pseudomonas aestuarii TaxID=3018340 RepID=A0ABT4XJU5_9PSED|nr:CAP domain-containing protein [Pseudomonas aestuarii]MDA7088455.1 CAP domain-containing protein [Pseudomonas aestuarii]
MVATREPLPTPRSLVGRSRLRGVALLLVAMLPAAAAQASEAGGLLTLINRYRQASPICDGRQVPSLGPLAADGRLARVLVATEAQLQRELKRAGYQAGRVQVIALTGFTNVTAVMAALKQRYCGPLLDPQYSEIGVLRRDKTWQLILAQPQLSPDLGDWQQAGRAILQQVNQARASPRNCGAQAFAAAAPLTWNARLANSALAHSRDMAARNYFSHTGKGGSQADVRAQRAGYRWQRIGENIAAGQGSATLAVAGWLASPSHCPNIMNPHFTEMGAAYAVNPESDSLIYWTQVFGTPR